MKPRPHPPSLPASGKPLPGLRAFRTGGSHFKPFALVLAVGAGLVAGGAQAQTILNVGGVGVIADETLPATGNLPVGGTNWSVVGNNSGVKYSGLVSPAVTVGASGPVILTFNHRYNFEATGDPWDGGAVFVSVNDGAFTYVPSASFSANPYVGPTIANAGSAWATGGEDVFYGESAGYATPSLITSVANVGTLTAGDTVKVEFRGGWDAAELNGPPAWEIGTVKLTDAATTDILDADFTANGKSGFTVANIGTVTAPWTYLQAVSRFEIDATAVTSDRYAPVIPASVINLNGANIQVAVLSGTLAPGQVYTLFDLSGGTTLTGALGSISLPTGTWDTTSLATTGTITFVAPVIPACQLGVLSLAANGGINPNTGVAWKVGDKYRLAFHTNGNTVTTSNSPDFYNDFSTTEAWTVPALQGTYWKAMVTVNLDPTTTQALSPKREAKVNTGTGNLTGGSAQGGAGEPVYVVNGTTCIASNNADIWNTWSNPFENSLGVPNATGTGNNTQRVAGVFYSPFLDQNGNQTVTPNAVHGKDVATGCDSAGNHLNALGNTTDVTTINRGNSNANNTGRVWARFTDTTVTPRSLYVISVPLTIVDTNETIDPTLISFVDDRAGADFTLGTGSLVYTVTFSEPMDASTLTTADFDNAGTATVTIDKIRGTLNPAAFEVTVTPTTAGTVQLRTIAAAVIEDPVGNPVDTTSPIPDDTTINVVIDTTAPTLTSVTDNVAGGPVVAFNGVTYTVNFDEPMSAATIDALDFGNGGDAPIGDISVMPTGNPAVFTVVVTPTGAGELILEIVVDATITDLVGNALVTTTALPDNTTITVTPDPLPTLVSITDNQAGGPVFETQSFTYFVTFDQVINPSTVNVTSFVNEPGQPAITVNAVARTDNPAVFAVHVTPGGTGSITLQIAAGAVIENLNGTVLDPNLALPDDTTILVNAGSGPARGTITVNGSTAWSANSATLTGTLNASASDKLVVVVTGEHGNPGSLAGNSFAVTYDGVPLTKIVDRNPIGGTPVDQTYNDIWYLDNPGAVHVAGAISATVDSRGNVSAFALSGTAPGAGQTAISAQESKSVVLSTTFANSIVIASHGMGGDGNSANVTAVSVVAPLEGRMATAQASGSPSPWDGHVTAYAFVPTASTATYAFSGGNLVGSHTIAAEFFAAVIPTGGPYDTWAAVNAPSGNPNDDFDGDGVPNAIEFVLGGLATTNDLGLLPAVATSGGDMTFTFVRDRDSVDPSVSVVIEVGTDLVTWPDVYTVGAITGGGVTVTDNLDGTDTITLTVTQAPDTKKFARLKVVITP